MRTIWVFANPSRNSTIPKKEKAKAVRLWLVLKTLFLLLDFAAKSAQSEQANSEQRDRRAAIGNGRLGIGEREREIRVRATCRIANGETPASRRVGVGRTGAGDAQHAVTEEIQECVALRIHTDVIQRERIRPSRATVRVGPERYRSRRRIPPERRPRHGIAGRTGK